MVDPHLPLTEKVLLAQPFRYLCAMENYGLKTSEKARQILREAYNKEMMKKIMQLQTECLKPVSTIIGLAGLYNTENPHSAANPHVIRGIAFGARLLERELKEIVNTTAEFDTVFNEKIKEF